MSQLRHEPSEAGADRSDSAGPSVLLLACRPSVCLRRPALFGLSRYAMAVSSRISFRAQALDASAQMRSASECSVEVTEGPVQVAWGFCGIPRRGIYWGAVVG